MKEDRYSLGKYREAEKAGRHDLNPEERVFLDMYRQVEHQMEKELRQSLQRYAKTPSSVSDVVLGQVLLNLFDPDRRKVIFGKLKKWQLERRALNTVTGQLDAAHDEAVEVNKEYDRHRSVVVKSVQEFVDFAKNVNEGKEIGEGNYSLEHFNEARRTGEVDLSPAEVALLNHYDRVRKEMNDELRADLARGPVSPNSGPMEIAIAHMLVNLFDRERRRMMFSERKVDALKQKRLDTVAGQLDAAHDEAWETNREYDRRREVVRKPLREFLDFAHELREGKKDT